MPLNPTEEEQEETLRSAIQDRVSMAYWVGFAFGAIPTSIIIVVLLVTR